LKKYVVGVDLGREIDPTAFAVLDRSGNALDLVHLARFVPIREDLLDVATRLEDIVTSPALAGQVAIAVDGCGVGREWIRLVRGARLATLCPIYAVVAVGNLRPPGQKRGQFIFCPKALLVANLARLGAEGRLRMARGLEHEDRLRRELATFRTKGREDGGVRFENDHRADHDDLVSALLLAAWVATEQETRGALMWRPILEVA
jgi:hypothetical protein